MILVSYNVRYFSQPLGGLLSTRRGLEAVAAAVADLHPDIVCLQEVEDRSLRSRSREPQLEAFSRAFGRPHHARYFPVHALGRIYTTGLGILVHPRFSIAAQHTFALGGRGERRACAHLELRTGSDSLHVFNTHLSLPPPFVGLGHGATQLRQAQELHRHVCEVAGDHPFVVCGDFNARPSSPVHQHLAAWSSPSADESPTAAVGPFRRRLDYLFAGNGIRWLEWSTPRLDDRSSRFHGLSDHVPLIARFGGASAGHAP